MSLDILEIRQIVLGMGKSRESRPVEVDDQGLIGDAEDIDSHVELLAPNDQWVHNITLDNIRLAILRAVLPILNVHNILKQEYPFPLCLPNLNE